YDLDVYLHENEAEWLEDPSLNGSIRYPIEHISTSKPEFNFEIGMFNLANFTFEVIHTPGHSPGSVSFLFHDERVVFSGDVLFRHGIGRTDLNGGNPVQLQASIQNHLFPLDDRYIVYPGHGVATTIGDEKENNPFVSP